MIGPNVADLLRQLGGADVRNDDIRKHQIQCRAELLEPGERLDPVTSFIDPMTLLLQYPNGQLADALLRPRSPARCRSCILPGTNPDDLVRSTGASARTWGRQTVTVVPVPGGTFDPNVAAALLHDTVDGGQTQSGTGSHRFGGEEGLEDLLKRLGSPCRARYRSLRRGRIPRARMECR